jgi:hypothetical protein
MNMVSTINPNMDPVKNKTAEISIRLSHLVTVDGLVVQNENPNVVYVE